MSRTRFRYDSALAGAFVFAILFLAVGLGLAILAANQDPPGTALFTLFLLLAGIVMFAIAKLSVLRKEHRLSFGWRNMTSFCRWLYVWGYALMGLGVLLGIGVLFVARG